MPAAGTIPLVNDFSIHLILTRGRVSLAHLLEFSNFLDLYVLEDQIYVDDPALSVSLAPLSSDLDSPLKALLVSSDADAQFDDLWHHIAEVREHTFGLYNGAPVSRSFSVASYEYWLSMSEEEKKKIEIKRDTYGRVDWFGRDGLLYSSVELDIAIRKSLEKLGETSFTLLPSPCNVIPFLSAFHAFDIPALLLYREIAAAHRVSVEQVLSLIRPRTVYLPPLLSILLSRCETRDDLPKRMMELRAEYAPLRAAIRTWFNRLDDAEPLADKIEIRRELDAAIAAVLKRSSEKRRGFYKQLAGAAIEGAAEGDLKKMLVKPAVTAAKEAIASLVPDAVSFRRFTGLIDLLDQALAIEGYSTLLGRVFRDDLDVSQLEITAIKQYQRKLVSSFDYAPALPS